MRKKYPLRHFVPEKNTPYAGILGTYKIIFSSKYHLRGVFSGIGGYYFDLFLIISLPIQHKQIIFSDKTALRAYICQIIFSQI